MARVQITTTPDIKTTTERLAVLETKMNGMETQNDSIESKLDGLISLQNKGIGAFWLASAIVGSGIIGFFATIFGWFKHWG